MALRIEVKPNERLIIGNAVVTNSGTRTHLQIEGDAPILREKDIMRPEDANTPCKRIYLSVLMMYLSDDTDAHLPTFTDMIQDVLQAAPSMAAQIHQIQNRILTGSLYKAVKEAKSLIEYEEELLDNARSR